MTTTSTPPCLAHTALVLTGGGARTAYQVGVLDALAEVLGLYAQNTPTQTNPFPILTGTSAGALNAAFLAGRAHNMGSAIQELLAFWRNLQSEQVYEVGALRVASGGAKWLALMSLGWLIRRQPRSLLDNTPLVDTLHRAIRLQGVDAAIDSGHLQALAITASSYSSGVHWTFCQSNGEVDNNWHLPGRRSLEQVIGIDHLLASSALPFIFPAEPLWGADHREYFGDGSMRQSSPLGPAVHLGAERMVVIGAGRSPQELDTPAQQPLQAVYPSLGAVAGHSLASMFHDTLEADIEQARRITQSLQRISPLLRHDLPFKELEILSFSPSQSIETLALEHVGSLPLTIRKLLGAVGGTQGQGAALASYILFEAPFVQALIELGRHDVLRRSEEVRRFMQGQSLSEGQVLHAWP